MRGRKARPSRAAIHPCQPIKMERRGAAGIASWARGIQCALSVDAHDAINEPAAEQPLELERRSPRRLVGGRAA